MWKSSEGRGFLAISLVLLPRIEVSSLVDEGKGGLEPLLIASEILVRESSGL